MSTKERGALGGRARSEKLTPEQRREQARRAHLAGAVKAVVDRAPELTPEQVSKLRTLFGGAVR
ncbi:hypothetical protein [Actinoplanes sp. NPDC049802]|uniref:hypothetical protein n=1 Tax=Actinoplanes sp. NPDC049802 TaxID=3154742 RepID=UPI0033DB34B7